MRKIIVTAIPRTVLKDKQWSVIQFLMLENVLGCEIHMRMCVVYGVHKINCVQNEYRVSRWDKQIRATNLGAVHGRKEGPV